MGAMQGMQYGMPMGPMLGINQVNDLSYSCFFMIISDSDESNGASDGT